MRSRLGLVAVILFMTSLLLALNPDDATTADLLLVSGLSTSILATITTFSALVTYFEMWRIRNSRSSPRWLRRSERTAGNS